MYAWNVLMRMACKNECVPFGFFPYCILLGSHKQTEHLCHRDYLCSSG